MGNTNEYFKFNKTNGFFDKYDISYVTFYRFHDSPKSQDIKPMYVERLWRMSKLTEQTELFTLLPNQLGYLVHIIYNVYIMANSSSRREK